MREDGKFCRAYLRTMDPEQAARAVGRQDGYIVLGQKNTQAKLEEMRGNAAAQLRREDVLRRLAQLAFGSAENALKLALEPTKEAAEGLDLSAVAEFKVTEKGVEIKLVDRIKALEILFGLLESGDDSGAEELYRALEEAAEQMEGGWSDG